MLYAVTGGKTYAVSSGDCPRLTDRYNHVVNTFQSRAPGACVGQQAPGANMSMPRKTVEQELRRIYGGDPQDLIYVAFQEEWHFWNEDTKQWEQVEEPHDPTKFLLVRVWADLQTVREYANAIKQQMENLGFKCVEDSDTYMNHPPMQLEGRIYFKFLPAHPAA